MLSQSVNAYRIASNFRGKDDLHENVGVVYRNAWNSVQTMKSNELCI